MKKIQKILTASLLIVFSISFCAGIITVPGQALATDGGFLDSLKAAMLDPNDRPTDVTDIEFRQAVRNFMNYFLGFLGLVAVIFVVYAGILMVTAGGDDEGVKKGKKILIWAVAGIIIVLLSYTAVRMVLGAGS